LQQINYQPHIKILLLMQNSFLSQQTKKVQASTLLMAACTLPNYFQSFIYTISRQNSNHRI